MTLRSARSRNFANVCFGVRLRRAKLLFRLTQDVDALDSLYLRVLVPMGAALAAAIATGFSLILLQPTVGIAVGLFLIAAGLGIPIVAARVAERSARRRAHALEVLRSRVIDLVSGQTELVMAGRVTAQRGAIADADRKAADADDELNLVETTVAASFGTASSFLIAAMLLVVTDLDGTILLWESQPESWKNHACQMANRQLTPDEWANFMTGRAFRPVCSSPSAKP